MATSSIKRITPSVSKGTSGYIRKCLLWGPKGYSINKVDIGDSASKAGHEVILGISQHSRSHS